MEVPREAGGGQQLDDRRHDHYSLLEKADHFYRAQLRQHPQAGRAVDYLKARGLSGEIAQTFGIGYAPPGWDSLLKHLSDAHSQKLAVELGLLVQKEDGSCYDRFRDRVMFPIRDRRGRCIGFGGRVLGDDKPKYMNSPESPVFHKGQELYGLFEARKASQKLERLLVVEGYMDVVALAQFGLTNAVATLGTATTPEHLERLYRAVSEVVFCFDGDAAGRRAAWRALENTLPVLRDGREARFLFLPEGEDPDSLVRKIGADTFRQKTVESVPLSRFFYESLCQQVDTGSVDGRARLVDLAKPLLNKLPDSVFRDLMLEQLSQYSGLKLPQLKNRIFGAAQETVNVAPAKRHRDMSRSPVRMAIRLLLEQPALAEKLQGRPDFEGLDLPGVPLLTELLELTRHSPNLSTGGILEHWRGRPEEQHLARLATTPLDLPSEGYEAEFCGAVQRLVEQRNSQRADQLLLKERQTGLNETEKHELRQILGGLHPNSGTAI
jgi:DNA primase